MGRVLILTDEEKATLHECAELIRSHLETLTEQRIEFLTQTEEIPTAIRSTEQFRESVRVAMEHFVEALESEAGQQFYFEESRSREEIQAYIEAGLEFKALFMGIVSNEHTILPFLLEQYANDPAQQSKALQAIQKFYDIEVEIMVRLFIAGKEEIIARQKEEIIASQRRAISELSSPVIQVWEDVLVLPLVGAIDSERARRITEDLLNGIVDHQAEQVIIDITGVPVVDTSVANHLLQTIKAARLLGARCLLVGIKSEVAQAMVHLGIDLSGVVTRANLQAGIEYVLAQMGLSVTPSSRALLSTVEERRALPTRVG